MDSSSSSPSHSFKDRPRSRHGEFPRQSHGSFDRNKSPAPPPKPAAFDKCAIDVRRSYSSDRDNGDSPVDASDRPRSSSIRRPSSFHFKASSNSASSERFRSISRVSGSRSHDRDGDGGARPSSFRRTSSHLSDGSDERDYPKNSSRKCHDRESDDDAKSFPRPDNRDAFRQNSNPYPNANANPNPNRDGALRGKDSVLQEFKNPGMSLSATEKRRGSKVFGREKDLADLDDMDVTSPKSKFVSKDDCREHGGSSADTEVRSWNRSSHGAAGDDEEQQWPEANGEEAWRDMSPPLSFLHISKRARSDRDRGRREDKSRTNDDREQAAVSERQQRSHRTDELDVNKEKAEKDCDGGGSETKEVKDDAESNFRNVDATSGQSENKLKRQPSVPSTLDKSDVEEGEVEPEGYAIERPLTEFTDRKTEDIKGKEGDQSPNPKLTANITEASECISKAVTEVEIEENGSGRNMNAIIMNQDDSNDKCDPVDTFKSLPDKENENLTVPARNDTDNMQSQDRDLSTVIRAEALEPSGNQSELQTFELLDDRQEAKTWNLNSTENYSSKELTLSLFTKPDEIGVQVGSSEQMLGGSSKFEDLNNGKRTERTQSTEDRTNVLQHLGGNGSESGQHSGHKQKKMKMDSGLLLSLALPGTSAMAANPLPAVGPVEPERSVQSLNQTQTQSQTQMFSQSQTHTNSDGFASSFSFSQSQSFIHNPSCSLNCTSVENQELSCGGSRQVSQGSWPALSGNEQMSNGTHTVTSLSQDRSKHRRGIPLYQRILQNGNIHQAFPSVTGSNRSSGSNHVSQRSHQFVPRFQEGPKIVDSSTQDLEASGHQGSGHRDLAERVRQHKAYFASKQQSLSGAARSEGNASQGRDKSTEPPPLNAKRVNSLANDNMLVERNVLSENIGLHEIATEPVAVMAQKLQELPDSYIEGLKGLAKGMLTSFEKREELKKLQDIVRSRTDLTEETLLRAHGAQLAIFVAFKTGMQVYVQEESKKQTYKALIDIFLQTKCRNTVCQQSLPVGGCECRICSKKSGFCHDCMCVVCYKFDSDNNTCRWVGCDVCLHWCHTDCGLRMSYISPTPNANGTSEMQYHCVACDHKSELFGFVKEVFRNCADGWGAETLSKELDCVMRIFHGSEDMRGKQLCWQAQQMLKKLENKADAGEVCRSMLRFFNEGNAELDGASAGPNKKPSSVKTNDITERQENTPKVSSGSGNKVIDLDKARTVLQNFDCNVEEKRPVAAELQFGRARKNAEIEDIESAVRIKQKEAKMFQLRADEARKEAGGLQRIITAKREKIDEDYACKYTKLRLNEAEERRQKRLEELQSLENAQNDFQKMKIRMEAEIKELLLKMELAKRQFA